MAAAVAWMRRALDKVPALELVDERDHARSIDAERRAERGLAEARIGGDQRQGAELPGRQLEIGHGLGEIREYRDLGPAQPIAEEPVQHARHRRAIVIVRD